MLNDHKLQLYSYAMGNYLVRVTLRVVIYHHRARIRLGIGLGRLMLGLGSPSLYLCEYFQPKHCLHHSPTPTWTLPSSAPTCRGLRAKRTTRTSRRRSRRRRNGARITPTSGRVCKRSRPRTIRNRSVPEVELWPRSPAPCCPTTTRL